MDNENKRSLEDIKEGLKLAKLKEDDLKPITQTIYFTPNDLHENKYRLLELNPTLLADLNEIETFTFKGDDHESVVLCTDKHTYDIVETETSNSMLLVENLKTNTEIHDKGDMETNKVIIHHIFYNYLEATMCKPSISKLIKLLEKAPYKGAEHEYEVNENCLYTYEQLTQLIQISDHELKAVLNDMGTVAINGKIRLLDFEYHFRVLSYMLKLIEENSWALNEIDYEETINSLQDIVPVEILNALFDKYAEESQIIDGLQLFGYKEEEVCKFFAEVLLHEAARFNLDDFMEAWKHSVPEGMVVREEMLYGIAIIERKVKPNSIKRFLEENLPESILDRFHVLFEAKEKWTVDEISPYIKRLTTSKLDVNALLAKYARSSTQNGIKYYSAKHGK